MTDHPILFSAPMVRALLDGRKTMTRRVLKPQPAVHYVAGWGICRDGKPNEWTGLPSGRREPTAEDWQRWQARCVPTRWAPGDRLWVREGFANVGDNSDDIHACPDLTRHVYYRADSVQPECLRWRSTIHMPRWASRITLAVEAVRVERLQDIGEGDAIAEGCFFTDYGRKCFHQGGPPCDPGDCPAPDEHHPQWDGWMWDATTSTEECLGSARSAFGNLWERSTAPTPGTPTRG